VGRDRDGLARSAFVDRLGNGIEAFLLARRNHDGCPVLGETSSNRLTDAATGSCYESDLPFEHGCLSHSVEVALLDQIPLVIE
jgi:hypothetical protein